MKVFNNEIRLHNRNKPWVEIIDERDGNVVEISSAEEAVKLIGILDKFVAIVQQTTSKGK